MKIKFTALQAEELNHMEVEWIREELDGLTDAAKANADNGDTKEGGRYRSLLQAFNKLS